MLAANPAGGYLLYQIGDAVVPAPQWEPCYNASSAAVAPAASPALARPSAVPRAPRSGDGSGIYVRSAPSLTGPWTLQVGCEGVLQCCSPSVNE